jgi:hypothetical protein
MHADGMEDPMQAIHFDVERPSRYEPVQIVLRLLLMVLLAVIGAPLGWVFCVLYVGLPVLAAITVTTRGAAYYHQTMAPGLLRGLRWLLGVYAYLALLSDRLPLSDREAPVRFEVEPAGTPSVSGALLHLLTSIPAALVMWVLGVVSAVLWIVGAIYIAVRGSYPDSIFGFQRGLLRMFARFIAHHASLVEGPAPLGFDTGADAAGPDHDVMLGSPR